MRTIQPIGECFFRVGDTLPLSRRAYVGDLNADFD